MIPTGEKSVKILRTNGLERILPTQSVQVLMLLSWRNNLPAKWVRCCLLSVTATNFHFWIDDFSKWPVVNSQNGSTRLLPMSHSSEKKLLQTKNYKCYPYRSPIPGYTSAVVYKVLYFILQHFYESNPYEQTLKIPICGYFHFMLLGYLRNWRFEACTGISASWNHRSTGMFADFELPKSFSALQDPWKIPEKIH